MSEWEARTRRRYEAAGLASRVGWGERPALVVVDLAKGFTDPASPLGGDLGPVLRASATLLAACRAGGHPVVFTTVAYRADFADAATFVAKVPALRVLVEGSEWVAIDDRVAPRPGEPVVVKKFASAFFGTDLHERLRAAGIDTVVVAGCSTSGCVRATAVDAMQHGFRTIVVAQAVGDRADGPHRANLFDIDAKYGDVVELDAALEALAERAVARPGTARA